MRAICIREFGGIDKIKLENLPDPKPGPGEALLRVKAAALNHLDLWVRRGRPGLTLKDAHVLGSDGAGVVAALGPGCEGLAVKPGDEVLLNPAVSCLRCEACLRGMQSECAHFRLIGFQLQGTYAELAVVPALNLFPKPPNLSWEEAAALPLAHMTAFRMLAVRAQVQPGDTVLIHGIGGGVALAGLQLALLMGASVLVTSSSDAKLALAKKLGARDGLNYKTTPDVGAAVKALTGGRGVDVVFDTAGTATLAASMAALRRAGRIVTCGITSGAETTINLQQLYWNHLSLLGSTMGSMDDLRRLVRLAADRSLKPVIDRVFPLDQAAAATARMEAGEQCGKIVLTV
jgi:NADPH:quinone reductase-like Zn-dependent oxidoreductase